MNIAIKPENMNTRQALAGKVSLITGSTSGIGLGIARVLAAAGSGVVLNGFGTEEVAAVQAKIASDFQVRVSYSPADMSKPAAGRPCSAASLDSSSPIRWRFWARIIRSGATRPVSTRRRRWRRLSPCSAIPW
jgi:3-hydroxybutyrate dehydrogenase